MDIVALKKPSLSGRLNFRASVAASECYVCYGPLRQLADNAKKLQTEYWHERDQAIPLERVALAMIGTC
jgi:hypothetical protein